MCTTVDSQDLKIQRSDQNIIVLRNFHWSSPWTIIGDWRSLWHHYIKQGCSAPALIKHTWSSSLRSSGALGHYRQLHPWYLWSAFVIVVYESFSPPQCENHTVPNGKVSRMQNTSLFWTADKLGTHTQLLQNKQVWITQVMILRLKADFWTGWLFYLVDYMETSVMWASREGQLNNTELTWGLYICK